MSSIDDVQLRTQCESLFDEVLVPIARNLRERGVAILPLQPDVARLSYFVRRSNCSMTRQDFLAPSCRDVDDFERRLAAHWGRLGRTELLAHLDRFRELARTAKKVAERVEQKDEVSPLIYVMF